MLGEQLHEGPRLRAVGILGRAPLAVAVTRHLLTQFPPYVRVSVFGHLPACTAELVGAGARAAASPADLAARSQLVLAVFTEPGEIEHSLSGPSGLEAGVHSPTTLVFGSEVPSAWLVRLSERLFITTAGLLQLVQAPLELSAASADLGELAISVRAGPSGYRSALPVLQLLGHAVHRGGLGDDPVPVPSVDPS